MSSNTDGDKAFTALRDRHASGEVPNDQPTPSITPAMDAGYTAEDVYSLVQEESIGEIKSILQSHEPGQRRNTVSRREYEDLVDQFASSLPASDYPFGDPTAREASDVTLAPEVPSSLQNDDRVASIGKARIAGSDKWVRVTAFGKPFLHPSVFPSNAKNTKEYHDACELYKKVKDTVQRTQLFPTEEDLVVNSIVKLPEQPPPPFWCHIYYYEFNERVGEPFKGDRPEVTVDGLCAPSDASRFCLGVVGNANRNPVVVTARRQIGKGCKMFQRDGDIYIECIGDSVIFVQSPIYAASANDHLATVYRLPTGQSMQIFNNKTFNELLTREKPKGYNAVYSLQVMCHVRVSFVKGWGARYRRQTITDTPCWVEVHLPVPLQTLDKTLLTLESPEDDMNCFM